MSDTKTVVRPVVCPFCGVDLNAALVRRVVANIYEMHCDQCDCNAVIHSGDQFALASTKIGSGNPSSDAE